MRPCPTCNFLLESHVQDCRFCGTNLAAAEAAAADAAARAKAEAEAQLLEASSTTTFTPPVLAAAALGIIVVAIVAFLTFGGSSSQPVAASDRLSSTKSPATTAPATTSTTVPATAPTHTATPGYTLFGVPNVSANVEIPTGSTMSGGEDDGFVKVDLGGGIGLAIGSCDQLPVGGTAGTLLAYMQQSDSVGSGDYDDQLSNLHIVGNSAGPAVAFTYKLDDGLQGQGTMILVNQALVMVQLVQTPGSPITAQQIATYAHAVATITPVL